MSPQNLHTLISSLLGTQLPSFTHLRLIPSQVSPGDFYINLPGHTLRETLHNLALATQRGARLILKSKTIPYTFPAGPTVVEVDDLPETLARLATTLFPRQPHCIVGVTGTCGKSSSVSFLGQMWYRLGYLSASIGTLGAQMFGTHIPNLPPFSLTTPKPFPLHYMLDRFATHGITHVALEASSQGLEENRLRYVKLAAGIFTNLHHDHLDIHGTYEAYFAAKARLFSQCLLPEAPAILHRKNRFFHQLEALCRHQRLRVYRVGATTDELSIASAIPSATGTQAVLHVLGKAYSVFLPVPGDFQIDNFLCCLGIFIGLGIPVEDALETISTLKSTKGRLHLIGILQNGARIYVDYAHKPLALERLLLSLKQQFHGRITLVFGCGGFRDAQKRPLMGAIAARLADKVIVTDDNPRSECPALIRSQILFACPKAEEIPSREQAIMVAISSLQTDEICVIAGKGHETGQVMCTETLPFSDIETSAAIIHACGGHVLTSEDLPPPSFIEKIRNGL